MWPLTPIRSLELLLNSLSDCSKSDWPALNVLLLLLLHGIVVQSPSRFFFSVHFAFWNAFFWLSPRQIHEWNKSKRFGEPACHVNRSYNLPHSVTLISVHYLWFQPDCAGRFHCTPTSQCDISKEKIYSGFFPLTEIQPFPSSTTPCWKIWLPQHYYEQPSSERLKGSLK